MKLLTLTFALVASAAAQKLIPLDEGGYTKVISSNKGKVTLVSFWATWCVPCRAEVPRLVQLEKRLQDKGLKLVLISADDVDSEMDARRFLTTKNVPMPSYQKVVKNDDKFIEGLDPKWSGALPALFLYDKTGKKVKSFVGETEMAALEAAVKKLQVDLSNAHQEQEAANTQTTMALDFLIEVIMHFGTVLPQDEKELCASRLFQEFKVNEPGLLDRFFKSMNLNLTRYRVLCAAVSARHCETDRQTLLARMPLHQLHIEGKSNVEAPVTNLGRRKRRLRNVGKLRRPADGRDRPRPWSGARGDSGICYGAQ